MNNLTNKKNETISLFSVREILQKHSLLVRDNIKKDAISNHLSYNSKDLKETSIFFIKGLQFKEEYFNEAKKIFLCYIAEKEWDNSSPCFIVNDVKKALSIISIYFFNHPSKAFDLIGVTGTAGKTTTTYMINSICNAHSNKKTGIISTNETFCGGETKEAENTTPESLRLQELFNEARNNNLPFVSMEVSSQAYSVFRVYEQEFDIGIFMNIDKDHIGGVEHSSYEDYLNCKLELIKNSKNMLVFAKTKEIDKILQTAKTSNCNLIFFDVCDSLLMGEDKNIDSLFFTPSINLKKCEEIYGKKIPYYFVQDATLNKNGFSLTFIDDAKKTHSYSCNMTGIFNVINAAAAITTAHILNISDENINRGLKNIVVPGRMNLYSYKNVSIIVDYAHNRLTLNEFLRSTRLEYKDENLVVVIGAAGKNHLRRDDIATLCNKYADFVIFTDEDPDFEAPLNICKDIARRMPKNHIPYDILLPRENAINTAIENATKSGKKTVVAILGKGAERFIKLFGSHKPCKSDNDVVISYIEKNI